MLSSNGSDLPLTASYDSTYLLVERASVTSGSSFTVSLYPTTKGTVSASFNKTKYTFQREGKTSLLSLTLSAPTATSTYVFTTSGSPLPLLITVAARAPVTSSVEKVKKQSVWGVLKFWKSK
jgi:hypothetical protein